MLYGKKIIALCTSTINDVQVSRFVNELNAKLVKSDFALFVYNINMDVYWEEGVIPAEASVYDLINYDAVDMIVIMHEKIKSNTVTNYIISSAKAHTVPAIVVDGDFDDAVCIGFDYEKGFEKIVRHVIEEHGVKRPHFMAGTKGNFFSEQRMDVFKKVIAENNIPFDESMISYGDFWATPASQAAKNIVESGNIPEAVICANDVMAINVCDVFKKSGIKVPEQVLVTGFDGSDEIYSFSPMISTVSCNVITLAETVYETIIKLANGQQVDHCILVEPLMYTNESCGCKEYVDPFFQMVRFNNNFYRYQDDVKVLIDVSGKIQMSDSIERAAECLNDDTYLLRDRILHNVCCIINKSCLREEVYYFNSAVNGFEPEMYLFYDGHSRTRGLSIARGETFPELKKLMEMQCPIIYTSLVYMDKPIGYVCFSFSTQSILDYTSVMQITNVLSMGLGGYIIQHHQRYLYKKLEEMYRTDALTKLYNRYGFQVELERCKNDRMYIGKPITIISCDLDGLKFINDNFGHDAGDYAISSMANALKSSCPEDSLCVRYGGDEMLAVVFGDYSPRQIIGNIDQYFNELNRISGLEYMINASCGFYTTCLTESFNLDFALKQADEEMYKSKKDRKSLVLSRFLKDGK